MKARGRPDDSPHGEFLLRTWSEMGEREPQALEVLRSRRDRKNSLYRLVGAGKDGGSVFAKLCRRQNAEIEPALYAELLSRLPLSVPHCYGTVAHEEGNWVFLEDVGTERADPSNPEHRELAARWLARLHLTTSRLPLAERLPARGPAHYLEMLRVARGAILANRGNPAFDDGHRAILDASRAQLGELEEHWNEIEDFCSALPRALVHGDFRPKNARVRMSGGRAALFAMDWETAGWGVPAPDLASARTPPATELVDLDVYRAEVRTEWPSFDGELVGRLYVVGGVFRRVAAIEWATHYLRFPWPDHPIGLLHYYREALEKMLRQRLWAA